MTSTPGGISKTIEHGGLKSRKANRDKLVTPNMEQMKNKLGAKRKVKGMMGLAIQHGADVADPV